MADEGAAGGTGHAAHEGLDLGEVDAEDGRLGDAQQAGDARGDRETLGLEVNGKRVDRPSYEVKVGDVISLRERSQSIDTFKNNFKESLCNLSYLQKDENNLSGKLVALPSREEVPIEVTDFLIIEYYSK